MYINKKNDKRIRNAIKLYVNITYLFIKNNTIFGVEENVTITLEEVMQWISIVVLS